jgi:hypothetical protein
MNKSGIHIFEAEVDGKTLTVMVPSGRVEEGEKFLVPFVCRSYAYPGASVSHFSIPVGHWNVNDHIILLFASILNIHHSYGDVLIDTRMICVPSVGLAVFTMCSGMLGVVHLVSSCVTTEPYVTAD